jgi:hypothetical protein
MKHKNILCGENAEIPILTPVVHILVVTDVTVVTGLVEYVVNI